MTWDLICDAPGWNGRWKHASAFHRDCLYIIGGYGDNGYGIQITHAHSSIDAPTNHSTD